MVVIQQMAAHTLQVGFCSSNVMEVNLGTLPSWKMLKENGLQGTVHLLRMDNTGSPKIKYYYRLKEKNQGQR
jgi:hypothetical protein